MSILGWFRSHSHREGNSLSKKEKDAIQKTLVNDYDITISKEMMSLTDIQERGLRKMGAKEVAYVTSVFQYIPQFATSAMTNQSVQRAFTEVSKDAYRVVLPKGVYMPDSKVIPGGISPTGIGITDHQVGHGNPVLFKIDGPLNVSNIPQLVNSVFATASLITGQYFMNQINGEMKELKEGNKRIEGYLDNARQSIIETAIDKLQDIMTMFDTIVNDEKERKKAEDQLIDICDTAENSMHFCQRQIADILADTTQNDDEKKVQQTFERISKYMLEYKNMLQVYAIATSLELRLGDVRNIAVLKGYQDRVIRRKEEYGTDSENVKQAFDKYVEENVRINKKNFLQNAAPIATGFGLSMFSGFIGGYIGGKAVADKIDDGKKKQKERVKKAENDYVERFSDMSSLDAPCDTINRLVEISEKEIEIVKLDDTYYTNLPEIESGNE